MFSLIIIGNLGFSTLFWDDETFEIDTPATPIIENEVVNDISEKEEKPDSDLEIVENDRILDDEVAQEEEKEILENSPLEEEIWSVWEIQDLVTENLEWEDPSMNSESLTETSVNTWIEENLSLENNFVEEISVNSWEQNEAHYVSSTQEEYNKETNEQNNEEKTEETSKEQEENGEPLENTEEMIEKKGEKSDNTQESIEIKTKANLSSLGTTALVSPSKWVRALSLWRNDVSWITIDLQGWKSPSKEETIITTTINQCYYQSLDLLVGENPQKEGYTFLEYNTCLEGEGEDCISLQRYDNFCNYESLRDWNFILYARYEPLITVSFYPNGGEYSDSSSFFSKYLDKNACYYETPQNITHSDPTKEKAKFLWYSTCSHIAGAECLFFKSTDNLCTPEVLNQEEVKLYAIYKDFPTILFDGNGGTFAHGRGLLFKVIDTSNDYWYHNPGNLIQQIIGNGNPQPHKEGYRFLNYFSTCKEGDWRGNNCETVELYGNLNEQRFEKFYQENILRLYAIFQKEENAEEPLNEYTVIFNFGEEFQEINVLHGEKISSYPTEYQGKSCRWMYQGEPFDFTQPITENIYLILDDEEEAFYHITYLIDEEVENPNPTFFTKNDTFILKAPVRTWHTFLGWFLSDTDESIEEIQGEREEDLILYAKWEAKNFIITAPDLFLFTTDQKGKILKVSSFSQLTSTETWIFSVIDYEGSNARYTTLAISDLELWDQKKAKVHFSAKESPLQKRENEENGIYFFMSKQEDHDLEYQDELSLSFEIPAFTYANTYRGEIVFTLYEKI